jgi:hypothetical protein
MEELLKNLASHVALAVEAVAVLVIAAGSLEAFIGLFGVGVGTRATHGARKAVWQRYGVWLLLGLEFDLLLALARRAGRVVPRGRGIGGTCRLPRDRHRRVRRSRSASVGACAFDPSRFRNAL